MKILQMLAVMVVGLFFPFVGTAQEVPELLRTYGDLDVELLVKVKAAALENDALAVLTDPTPAVHISPDGSRPCHRTSHRCGTRHHHIVFHVPELGSFGSPGCTLLHGW
jgi:hypothetical protein